MTPTEEEAEATRAISRTFDKVFNSEFHERWIQGHLELVMALQPEGVNMDVAMAEKLMDRVDVVAMPNPQPAGMAVPSVGRVVWYQANGIQCPAIITATSSGETDVALAVFQAPEVVFLGEVPYDPNGANHTWRWPTR